MGCRKPKIKRYCTGNDGEKHYQKLALLNQICFASLEYDFGYVEHRFVGWKSVNLRSQVQANAQCAANDQGTIGQQVPGSDAAIRITGRREKTPFVQVRDGETGFTGPCAGRKQQKGSKRK
jgi:hypothetical protein